MTNPDRYREAFIAVASLIVAGVAVYVCSLNRVLWVLVPIPGIVGLVYHVLNLSKRFDSRRTVVEEYRTFCQQFDRARSYGQEPPAKVSEDLTIDLDTHAPSLASMIWAASLLTAVFAIPAVISDGGSKLSKETDPALTSVSSSITLAQNKLAANSIDEAKKAIASAQASLKKATDGMTEAQRGIVYAGLGVWVLIVFRTIGRMNAGGLNARFLVTASLRAGVAMMLGYWAGAAGYFKDWSAPGATLYFFVGLTYPIFYDSLIEKAWKFFAPEKKVYQELPLRMVDGIDEDTADILTELNVSTVQHLATADPGVLTVRSLFSFLRVIDWIDQAILIVYVRDNIEKFRAQGIRGVIDFISTMQPIINNTADRDEAEATFTKIAESCGMTKESLYVLGLSIYYDYRINLLVCLWQHQVQAEGYTLKRPEAAEATTSITPDQPERITIRETGQASFSAFVNARIESELRREAAERAAKFREENPDTPRPEATWMTTSFSDAYTIASTRATIGSKPTASVHSKEVYEQAFTAALS